MENKISPILFIFGIICIIAAISMGEGKAGIFIIFPFIYGEGLLMFIGIILIFLSLIIFTFSQFHLMKEYENEMKVKKHAGGLILIGPIPIIISSNWKVALILLAIAIIIIFLLFTFHAVY
ncbi:MAG: DUF131 domain-containing protein [Thermoplasmata archaeon]|nr:MAG: DUF131 domain-containing protein [Thermoplasmata archaeon]